MWLQFVHPQSHVGYTLIYSLLVTAQFPVLVYYEQRHQGHCYPGHLVPRVHYIGGVFS